MPFDSAPLLDHLQVFFSNAIEIDPIDNSDAEVTSYDELIGCGPLSVRSNAYAPHEGR